MATEEKQVVEETAVVPGKMEFRLISPTESNFLKHIEWNKEELLAAVRSKVTYCSCNMGKEYSCCSRCSKEIIERRIYGRPVISGI